jgi:hypothetical protein
MVARVYGSFAPRSDQRDRWEKIADAQDAEREAAKKTKKSDQMGISRVPHLRNNTSQPR